ncbi:MAG: hypothetical protein ACKOWF_07020 [Chloroflexota bacterium]
MSQPTAYPTWPEMRPLPADGIAGLYADRALDRGDDPRALAGLTRLARAEEERLPVMASPFPDGVVLFEMPRPRRARGAPRRLLVAAAVAAALIPLGAMVAGAQPASPWPLAGQAAPGGATGYEAEIELPEIAGTAGGFNPATLGLPVAIGAGIGAGGGTVTVDGRERRNQADAQVFTSEESTIVIDGEVVESAGRPPMTMPGTFPRIPGA